MRFQFLMLLATVATVALAREDTAELCTGSLSCDAGYCCSSHGFCGRSAMHCGHSSGCNSDKGNCGVVLLDKQDMPHVITYDELSQGTISHLAETLASEGSHVSPEEAKASTTIESILRQGLAEKEKMLASNPKPAVPAAVNNPVPEEKKDEVTKVTTPAKTNQATKYGADIAAMAVAAAVLFLGNRLIATDDLDRIPANDEIPIHINCQVSSHDAEKESALAKKFKKIALPHSQRRKRTLALNSGLTVSSSTDQHQHSSRGNHAISKPLGGSKDQKTTTGNRSRFGPPGYFLPSSSSTTLRPSATSKTSAASAGTAAVAKADTAAEGSEGQVGTENTKHVRGREVFGFQTGRKKTAGLKALIEAQLPQKDDAPAKHPGKGKASAATSASTTANSNASAKNKGSVSERMAKRRRVAGTISQMNKVTSSDEGEDEDDESDESDGEAEDEDDEMNGSIARDATQAHKKSIFEEDEMGAERYFQDLYQKSQTSNNTLSSLPTLERADYTMAMKQAPVKHAEEKEILNMLYEEQFQQWYFELRSGFNLLVYGYGSKRLLLTKFATTILTDAPLLIVNGYFPTLTIKDILDRISAKTMKYIGPTGTLSEQLAFIHAYFRQPDRAVKKIYLLIHNIDGPSLRSEKVQSALSVLASCPSIHLIASVDHINANILWDAVKAARFRWVWHELTTFSPYTAETSYENSIMVQQQDLGPRGIQYVLASLTSNGKGLFRILAEHQIQAELEGIEAGTSISGKTEYGMAYNALFKKCQENFLVSNAVTFKTQLTEFRDHRIVQSRKGRGWCRDSDYPPSVPASWKEFWSKCHENKNLV